MYYSLFFFSVSLSLSWVGSKLKMIVSVPSFVCRRMKCKVLDEGLLRGALGGPESAADEEIEEERGVLAEVDERLRKASACSTSVSEFLADEGEVAATLDTIDGVSRLLGALRRASRGLSRDLSQARVDLLRSAEALVDAKGTTSAVEEEKDGASLSLPQDVWRPFVQSGEKTTTNVTEKMGKRLWSEESMQEVTSCALRRSRLHSLLR